jgi:hypothetical protein
MNEMRLIMKKARRPVILIATMVLPLVLSGCLNVKVVEHVDDPGRYIDRALQRIEKIQSASPNREGHPHSLNVLVYDGDSRQIVQVETPLWIVHTAMDIGMHFAEHENDKKWGKRYDFDWKALSDFRQFGRGILVEVDDDDDKVLVWLD